MTSENVVAVLTRHAAVRDHALALATNAGLTAEVMPDLDAVLAIWHRAAVIAVGTDEASSVVAAAPARRREVFLIGPDADADALTRWSGPLGAVVVPLPTGAPAFAAALARLTSGAASAGVVVAVIGGSGGVGSSTVSAAITGAAVRRALPCALIDLDPLGGGLDLLMGVEHRPGWRWSRLVGAAGNLPDLAHELVEVDGAGLLSMDRGPQPAPRVQQVEAVLDAAVRDHTLTVVDLPRAGLPAAADVVRRAGLLVVVARADVRSFAATRQVLRSLPEPYRTGLVVRGAGLDALAYADRLSAELLGAVPDDRQVGRDVARGLAPGRRRRSGLARVADRSLDLVEVSRTPGRRGAAA